MADSGCSAADIGDYLSSRGCSGTLTSHRLKYNVDAVRQELEDYTVISQPGETEAEALSARPVQEGLTIHPSQAHLQQHAFVQRFWIPIFPF